MQRMNISKFRPIVCGVSKWGAIAPMLGVSRSFQSSLELKQKGGIGPGKLPPKMARLQQTFQAENDKPVFLKGGGMDSILYTSTLVLCAIGLVLDFWLYAGYILA